MTQILWIQIKKKVKVPTKNVMARHETRSDWPTLHTIDYEQSGELFEVVGNGPIRTTSEFVYLIHKSGGKTRINNPRETSESFINFLLLSLLIYALYGLRAMQSHHIFN
ncbi:MAG: hypothetical protein Q8N99_02830 [Nanoarchaeota archaeon]|nr:hypothetical protein [Nanoarchaeota archaeon]